MTIETKLDGDTVTLTISGKLTVGTAPDLEDVLNALPDTVDDITFDFRNLEYISSAGLRLCVVTGKKAAARGGHFRIMNPSEEVTTIFEITGLADVMEIVHD